MTFDPRKPYTVVAFDPTRPFTPVAVKKRGLGERFKDAAVDAFETTVGATNRELNPDGKWSLGDLAPVQRIEEGKLADRALDAVFGDDRAILRGQAGPSPAAAKERDRREAYATTSAADPGPRFGEDPVGSVLHDAVALGGAVVGSAAEPTNLIPVGRGFTGLKTAGQVALRAGERAAGSAAINAAVDVNTQGADVRSGVQDKYNPTQTLAAAGIGAAIGGAEAGGAIAAPRVGEAVGGLVERFREKFPDPATQTAPAPVADPAMSISSPAQEAAKIDTPPLADWQGIRPEEPGAGYTGPAPAANPIATPRVQTFEPPPVQAPVDVQPPRLPEPPLADIPPPPVLRPEPPVVAAPAPEPRQPLQERASRPAPMPTAPPRIADAINQAAQENGVSSAYLTRTAQAESGFRPSVGAGTSSALGLFQFTEGTWLAYAKRMGLTGSKEQILAARTNPELSAKAAAMLAADNAASLKRNGVAVTDGSLYASHFLGSSGAAKLYSTDANVAAATALPRAAKANRSVFYDKDGRPKTIGELRAWADRKMSSSFTPGATGRAFTPDGKAGVDLTYGIAELDDLVVSNRRDMTPNPLYPAELQPRDRTRAASTEQVTQMASTLRPELLTRSPTTDSGAPIVGPDMAVESGNGRALTLARVYEENGEGAAAYRRQLEAEGFDVSGYDRPVMVARRETPLDPEQRVEFARRSNERATAAMASSETSMVDADRLSIDVLDEYRGGGFDSEANAPFMRAVFGKIASPAELGSLIDARGRVSQDGLRRARGAWTQKAYGDAKLVGSLLEDTDNELGGIGKALQDVAPSWAAVPELARTGRIDPDWDASAPLMQAVSLVDQARRGKVKIAERFATRDAFDSEDPRVEQFTRLLYTDDKFTRVRSQDAIARDLESYARTAREAESAGMFGATSRDALDGLIAAARRKAERPAVDGGMFAPAPKVREFAAKGDLFPRSMVKETVYHGTGAAFDKFQAGAKRREGVNYDGEAAPEFYFTADPDYAARYAPSEGGNIRPSRLNVSRLYDATADANPLTVPEAWARGFDGIKGLDDDGEPMFIVRNPDQVRSVFDRDPETEPSPARPRNFSMASERVSLFDGEAEQGLIDGVAPVTDADRTRTIIAAKQGAPMRGQGAPQQALPAGGLFDTDGVGTAQTGDLFGGPPRQGKLFAAPTAGLAAQPIVQPRAAAASVSPTVKTAPAGPKLKGTATISRDLIRTLGLQGMTRQGRISGGKRVLGQYDAQDGVVRRRVVHEVDVLAHEGGHALDLGKAGPALTAALKTHAAELKPLAYKGADPSVQREEGFAEFFRWYVTNPAEAQNRAPRFYAAFETALQADDTKMADGLLRVQRDYQDFLGGASVDVSASRITFPGKPPTELETVARELGPKAAAKHLGDVAYGNLVDRKHPLNMAVRELMATAQANTGKELALEAADNPYVLARNSVAAYDAGQRDVIDGVRALGEVDPSSPALADAITTAIGKTWEPDDLEAFGAYLVDRRMLHEWDRYRRGEIPNPPDKVPEAVSRQAIADREAANPTWREAAQQVYAWNDALWKLERDAGYLTEQAYKEGLAIPDYVPAMRDVSDKPGAGGAGVKGDSKTAGGTHRFQGSTRDVLNPIPVMIERAQQLRARIAQNEILLKLDALAEKAGPGSGGIVERIPTNEISATTVNVLDALENAAKTAGLSDRDNTALVAATRTALGEQLDGTVFKSGIINTKGEPIVFAWRDGKPQAMRLGDDQLGQSLYSVLTGLDREEMHLAFKMLGGVTATLRLGITMNPAFWVTNYVRDQQSAAIITDVGYRPFLSGLRGLWDELTNSEMSKLYRAKGGLKGGAMLGTMTRKQVEADIRAYQKGGRSIQRLASWRALATVTEIVETGTRLGIFRLAYEKALKRGLTPEQASIEAVYKARDYMDFDRRGSKMLAAAKTVTFLNAGMQGLDKARRTMQADGATRGSADKRSRELNAVKVHAIMAGLGAAGYALASIYKDDEDYQAIPDYLKAAHWMVKVPGDRWLAIPKPFELAVYSNIAESMAEGVGLKRGAARTFEVMAPPHEVPAFAVPMQLAKNRDHSGHAIVPEHLKDVDPNYRYTAFTSRLGRGIAKAINAAGGKIAPSQVDHIITGVGGSTGRDLLTLTDSVSDRMRGAPRMANRLEDLPIAKRVVRDPTRGNVPQKDFWDAFGDLKSKPETVSKLTTEGRDEELAAYVAKLKPAERAFVTAASMPMEEAIYRQAHPMIRAKAATAVLSDIRTANRDARLLDLSTGEPITLEPAQRRRADGLLARLSMAEHRNALIASGLKGWETRQPTDLGPIVAELARVSPAFPRTIDTQMQAKKVLPPQVGAAMWAQSRAALEAGVDPVAVARYKRSKTTDGKIVEAQRQAFGAPLD